MLDKLQKWVCKTVASTLAASLEPLGHRRSLFYRYYFGRSSSELAELVPLYSRGKSSRYSDRLHDFSVTVPRCYKVVCVYSLTLEFSECFPLSYDLNSFTARVNRHFNYISFFVCLFFQNNFPICI